MDSKMNCLTPCPCSWINICLMFFFVFTGYISHSICVHSYCVSAIVCYGWSISPLGTQALYTLAWFLTMQLILLSKFSFVALFLFPTLLKCRHPYEPLHIQSSVSWSISSRKVTAHTRYSCYFFQSSPVTELTIRHSHGPNRAPFITAQRVVQEASYCKVNSSICLPKLT